MSSPRPTTAQSRESALHRPWGSVSLSASDFAKLIEARSHASGGTAQLRPGCDENVPLQGRAAGRASLALTLREGSDAENDVAVKYFEGSRSNGQTDKWLDAVVSSCKADRNPDFIVSSIDKLDGWRNRDLRSKFTRATTEMLALYRATTPFERAYAGLEASNLSAHVHEFDCNGLGFVFRDVYNDDRLSSPGAHKKAFSPEIRDNSYQRRERGVDDTGSSTVNFAVAKRPRTPTVGSPRTSLRASRDAIIGRKSTNTRLANSAGDPGKLVTLGEKRSHTSEKKDSSSSNGTSVTSSRLSKLAEKFKRARTEADQLSSHEKIFDAETSEGPEKARATLADIVKSKHPKSRVMGSSPVDRAIQRADDTLNVQDDELLKESNPRYALEKKRKERILQKRKEQEEKDARRASLKKKSADKLSRKAKRLSHQSNGSIENEDHEQNTVDIAYTGHPDGTGQTVQGYGVESLSGAEANISGISNGELDQSGFATNASFNGRRYSEQLERVNRNNAIPHNEAIPDVPGQFPAVDPRLHEFPPLSDEDGLIATDPFEHTPSQVWSSAGSSRFAAAALEHGPDGISGHRRFAVGQGGAQNAAREYQDGDIGRSQLEEPWGMQPASSPGAAGFAPGRYSSLNTSTARFANDVRRVRAAEGISFANAQAKFAYTASGNGDKGYDVGATTSYRKHFDLDFPDLDFPKLEESESKGNSKSDLQQFIEEKHFRRCEEDRLSSARLEMENVMNSELHNRIRRGSEAWKMIEDFFEGKQYMLDNQDGKREVLMDERWDPQRQRFVQRYFRMTPGQWEIRLV